MTRALSLEEGYNFSWQNITAEVAEVFASLYCCGQLQIGAWAACEASLSQTACEASLSQTACKTRLSQTACEASLSHRMQSKSIACEASLSQTACEASLSQTACEASLSHSVTVCERQLLFCLFFPTLMHLNPFDIFRFDSDVFVSV